MFWSAFVAYVRDLHTKYPKEMHGVYQDVRPYLSEQSMDIFHAALPVVALKDDLVGICLVYF